jgi:hypothetical protein
MFDFRMGRGREGPLKFLGEFEAFCRPTVTRRTNARAGRNSCMLPAGRMSGASSLMR